MTKSHLALVTPTAVFGSVRRGHPPRRRPNAESRAREYLTLAEVEKLMKLPAITATAIATPPWCRWPIGMAYARSNW